jgi:hypothetical protein
MLADMTQPLTTAELQRIISLWDDCTSMTAAVQAFSRPQIGDKSMVTNQRDKSVSGQIGGDKSDKSGQIGTNRCRVIFTPTPGKN